MYYLKCILKKALYNLDMGGGHLSLSIWPMKIYQQTEEELGVLPA
jgi:hypothetical protein